MREVLGDMKVDVVTSNTGDVELHAASSILNAHNPVLQVPLVNITGNNVILVAGRWRSDRPVWRGIFISIRRMRPRAR